VTSILLHVQSADSDSYTISTVSQQIQAFVDFAAQPNYDIYGALINSYAFNAASGWLVANNYEYTQPTAYPPVFQEYTSIQPQIFNTMRISNLSDFTIELNGRNPDGNRQLFYTSTYINDYTMLYQLFQQSNSSLQPVINVAGLSWSLSLQPIVPAITKFSAETGGNALGLDPSEGPLARKSLPFPALFRPTPHHHHPTIHPNNPRSSPPNRNLDRPRRRPRRHERRPRHVHQSQRVRIRERQAQPVHLPKLRVRVSKAHFGLRERECAEAGGD